MAEARQPPTYGVGFLLSQLGAHSAGRFAAAIQPLGVTPPHIGLLGAIIAEPGRTQQALSVQFAMQASRLVILLDELEARGLVERRRDPNDRRVHLVHATGDGRDLMRRAMRIGASAERKLLEPLNHHEMQQLAVLLKRMAEGVGLSEGVHPGYGMLRPKRS